MAIRSPVSVQELQRRYNISDRALEERCSDQHMLDISRFFINWELVAPRIGLDEHDVDAIQRNAPHSAEERRLGALRKWMGKCGFKATYKILIKAQLDVDRADLAEMICTVLSGGEVITVGVSNTQDEEPHSAPSDSESTSCEGTTGKRRLRSSPQPPPQKKAKLQSQQALESLFHNQETRREYLASGKENVSILLTGKVGIGKSSLVNGIIGSKVAEEGTSASAVTSEIASYERPFYIAEIGKAVKVKLWDTPGLSDPSLEEEDEAQLAKELDQLKNDVDLVIYGLDMRRRLERNDLEELERFSTVVGQDIWKHTAIALTYANEVVPKESGQEKDKQKHFRTVMGSWIELLQKKMIKKLNLPEDVVNEIPIVPVGYEDKSPPDREEWFSPLWTTAYQRMKPEAQPSMLAVSAERLRETGDVSQQAKNPENKSIYLGAEYPKYTMGWSKRDDEKFIEACTRAGSVVGNVIGLFNGGFLTGAVGHFIGLGVGKVGGHAIVGGTKLIESTVNNIFS